MTGFSEADAWLRENAPEWRIARGEIVLKASHFVGGPTEEQATVELVEDEAGLKQSMGMGYVTLTGEGRTYLEAVQRAVGGLTS